MNGILKHNDPDTLWKFSENLTSICILGALWFLCSLPVVTIGASTAAMHQVFLRNLMHGSKPLVRPFFTAFRENFKQSTILWLIMLAAATLLALDAYYYFCHSQKNYFHFGMGIAMLCLLGIVVMVFGYVFPMTALYHNSVKKTLMKSAQYAFVSWPWTLLMFAIHIAVPIILSKGLWFLALISAGVVGFADSRIMIRAFRRDIPAGRGVRKF